MHDNDSNAPPPPYRAHCGFDDAAASPASIAADAQVLIEIDQDSNDNDNNDNNTSNPQVSPPSYEATYDAGDAGRSRSAVSEGQGSRSGADGGVTYCPPKKESEWGSLRSAPGGSGGSSLSSGLSGCAHWTVRGCSLTSSLHRCCSCMDRRPFRADGRYPVYIDGLGDNFGSTTRWAHYCSPCQEAERGAHGKAYVYRGASVPSEVQRPDAAELRRIRREAARQAKAKAKAKTAAEQDGEAQHKAEQTRQQIQQRQRYYEQNSAYHATHTKKHERRVLHAQRMTEQERAADERAAQEAQEAQAARDIEADLVVLRELRRQVSQQASQLEVQLAEKRVRLAHLDQQIRLHAPTTPLSAKSAARFSADRSALAEKVALAEQQDDEHRRAVNVNTNDYEMSRSYAALAAVAVATAAAATAAAKEPLLSETTGSSSGTASGWLGRVFGRGKGKEKERERQPQLQPQSQPQSQHSERYYGEHFFAQKRAEADAAAQVKDYLREKEMKERWTREDEGKKEKIRRREEGEGKKKKGRIEVV